MRENVYNTTDPQKLLDLKRQEADALLDVMRTINQNDLKVAQLCQITKYVLLAQLGVRKMAFYYQEKDDWYEGMRHGFAELSDAAKLEVFSFDKTEVIDPERHPSLSEIKAEFVVPISHREDMQAAFVIAEFADTDVEAQNDLLFIETLGNILSVAIRNRQLFQEQMEQEFLRKELEVAGTIQSQMLISNFSRFKEIDVYGLNFAHHGVGGDFYDVIKKGKGVTFVCIADVSGKGIGAALLMSNLQANLRALCAQYTDPIPIVEDLNQVLYPITKGEKFVTLFLARIDADTRTITYVNAGHNYPIFVSNSELTHLESGCIFLGFMPSIEAKASQMSFEKDDILFMYTDGLIEQENNTGEMFGQTRVEHQLILHEERSSEKIIHHVMQDLEDFSVQTEAVDDITMLSVKFL
ncbi:MAG: PP2C family protein-serine/threonine phosphatase [Bacteroidota bacterium]